jgi:DNA processing protein
MFSLLDYAALSLLPIWWWRDFAPALRAGEPPGVLLERLTTSRRPGSTPAAQLRARAAAAIARGERLGLQAISWTDAGYPPSLAAIVDPPPVLWLRGRPGVLDRPSVAIVGSRAGSPYAMAVAEQLGADLSSRGVVVVSGLARGVDSAAHRGALRGAGHTVAVLGSGVDIVYPREHEALAAEIVGAGALVSEFLPGTPPHPVFFPRRNRVISGLVRAVVVVEAGRKSGSLITARCALEQGREVLAVPGNVLNGRNRGGHALLRDGAKIVESADDIFEELDLPAVHTGGPMPRGSRRQTAATDPILACLPPGEACDLDAIAASSGLAPGRLLSRLCELELQGFVKRAGGGRFVRVDTSC